MPIDFKLKQGEFAAYIRDPANNPPPEDVNQQRMRVYRELFFNNIDSTLSTNFPVLRQILTHQQWLELVQDFYAGHSCHTPYFSEIAEEFLNYLQNRDNAADYPFLLELAHYEWVEMALSISKELPLSGDAQFIKDIQQREIALSPVAWPLVYQYPVHQISPEFLPATPPEKPTFLVVYRDQSDKVRFMQTTQLTFRLLQILEEQGHVKSENCLQTLIEETAYPDPSGLINQGLKILQDMAELAIVIPVVCV